MSSDGVVLRRAVDSDAVHAAQVWLRSFAAALPTVRRAHDDDEVRDWFSSVVVPQYETWVAVSQDLVIGQFHAHRWASHLCHAANLLNTDSVR